ncbi:MAG: ISAs1 family transposase [Acidobacteria bacterium]|nr:ISAs1 family transposase [Acidobacteriota bacterium]
MSTRKLRSWMAHFEALDDPRIDRTRKHNLLDLVAIAICAVISGADSWVQVEAYGKAKHDWLQRFLQLPNGIPAHDTFGRVFAAINPEQFQACFRSWMAELGERLGLRQIAIDGKTLRGSHDRAKGKGALHLISAWAVENHLTLGQEAVDPQSNEITAIPKLLALLDLEGALVTIDALGCQKEIAEQIVEQGGDYVLAVKENQPQLYEEIERLDEAAQKDDYAGVSSCCVEETNHGRQELRACWVLTDLEELREGAKWPGLKSVIVVVRDRSVGDKNACEKHYYISSRKLSAKKFSPVVRGHWGIENSLHWVLDVVFAEDRHRVRKDHGPENFGMLRRMALSMIKAEESRGSIQVKRQTAGWNNDYLEKILLDFTEN